MRKRGGRCFRLPILMFIPFGSPFRLLFLSVFRLSRARAATVPGVADQHARVVRGREALIRPPHAPKEMGMPYDDLAVRTPFPKRSTKREARTIPHPPARAKIGRLAVERL